MIELQKVKRDVINYGALKVYTTFLTLSEDEVDPELFAASQLKEIFEKRFDVLKVDMSFVEGEEAAVVAKELLVFKLSKCSDDEISYMSNVDDEGKLSSLVLTKSVDEVSLEVVDYSIGGEEVPNVEEAPSGTITEALGLDEDGKVVKNVKKYLHNIYIVEAGGELGNSFITRIVGISTHKELPTNDIRSYYETILSITITVIDGVNERILPMDYDISVVAGNNLLGCFSANSLKVNVPPEIATYKPMIYNNNGLQTFDYVSYVSNLRESQGYHIMVNDALSTVTEL